MARDKDDYIITPDMEGRINRELAKKKTKIKTSFGDKVISVITYVIYAMFAFVCAYPFYYIFINTISANDISAAGDVIFWPKGIHFNNYVQVFGIENIFHATFISIARTVIGTITVVISSSFLGFMFTRETLWHRKLWYRLVTATMYINAGLIPWFLTMTDLHLRNNFLGYILPVAISPFYIVLCKTFIESVPKELSEAAEMDGAGTLKVFWKVIIPVIKPILATVALFTAVAQWNAFQDTVLLVNDKKLYTLQFILYEKISQASSAATAINGSSSTSGSLASVATVTSVKMTVTMVVVIPIMLIYPFFQKYFTKGIMIGAVKG